MKNDIPQAGSSAAPGSALAAAELRASMNEVAGLLRKSAESIEKMADSMRYDEPRGVRHALDVHALHLGDLAAELERPGQTKYSPNSGLNNGQSQYPLGSTPPKAGESQ